MLPLTAPALCTTTLVTVPCLAVTMIPADGSAVFAPFAGLIVTDAAAAALVCALAVCALAAGLAALVLCPPPVHAAISSVIAAAAPMPGSRLVVPVTPPPAPCISSRALSFPVHA